jgi:hypothetical protein
MRPDKRCSADMKRGLLKSSANGLDSHNQAGEAPKYLLQGILNC